MDKEIIIPIGVSNAGVSLTEQTNNNLLKIYEWANNNKDLLLTYRQIQEKVSQECNISKSNTRMYTPFLYKNGFVGDYTNGAIYINNYFTDLGKAYLETLASIKSAERIDNSVVLKQLYYSLQDICLLGLMNRQKINEGEMYLDFLKFCYKYDRINADEFYRMLYEREIGTEEYIDSIEDDIKAYRNGNMSFVIKHERRSEGQVIIGPMEQNIFTYTKTFIMQCGIITDAMDSYFKPVENKKGIIEYLTH